MTDYYTPTEEYRVDRATDVVFDLYRSCAFRQEEAALDFERMITNGDPRMPSSAEIRDWLAGAFRGGLVARPQQLSGWDRFVNWMRGRRS